MGGDSVLSSTEESLLGKEIPDESINFSVSCGDEEGLSRKVENGSVINGENGLILGEFPDMGGGISLISEVAARQRFKVYADVSKSYEELGSPIDRLEEAKSKILSYTPGSWAEKAGGMDLSAYNVPHTTSLLLIGPKGSGKSSLVNKISWVLEDNKFLSARAQVSCNSSPGGGTFFLHEYMMPRVSSSFCLYDTRSLSDDSYENRKMIKSWMKKGVRHGKLVQRKSDSEDLKVQLKSKARRSCSYSKVRAINFVIFVVNGISMLESIDCADEKKREYSQLIVTNFNNRRLSFKDDKPVVVVTHGDLLSLSERIRVRVYLGELLGIPPTTQIFDIPENNDSATALAIADMLIYCLERADRNLPAKGLSWGKVLSSEACMRLLMVLPWCIIFLKAIHDCCKQAAPTTPPPMEVEWHKIRHIW